MSKIKLLLLWWIFTLIWIFNFSSAINFTPNNSNDWYIPSELVVESPFDLMSSLGSYSCNYNTCYMSIHDSEYTVVDINITYYSDWDYISCNDYGGWYCYDWTLIPAWTYEVGWYENETFDLITINLPTSWWWDDIWVESWLVSIVSNLNTTISEFIPYVVYIGLWILSVIVWFYAIKWLLRFVKWSSLSVFSSRKRKLSWKK